jgi:hypothetical protein
MSKCCQYAINDTKVCVRLTSMSSNNVNLFCKLSSLGPRKVTRDIESGRKLVYTWAYIHKTSKL